MAKAKDVANLVLRDRQKVDVIRCIRPRFGDKYIGVRSRQELTIVTD